jgi:CheY-like chemotaxis protein
MVQPQAVNLNELIRETEDMLRRLVGEDISIVVSADPQLAPVTADPNQIHQVLMNLAANARDAMPNGGQLRIRTGNVAHDAAFAGSHRELTPGEFVLLEIADTGAGMDERTKSRLFEPFFTTKALGRGTGLGLATVYGIVRQSHGAIDVESEPGRGTTFRIYLPRSLAMTTPPPVPADASPRVTGSERVLVVEDVDGLRRLAVETLTGQGYEVMESPDGASALAMARKPGAEIDLLITDVIMPGMSGRELAERMRELRPRLRVLYMSGYAEEMISRHGVLDPAVMFLPKPFTPEKLLLKVRAALKENGQP